MYIGLLTRWKDKYFILHDNILSYCAHQGGPSQGRIHIDVATIKVNNDEPLRIQLNTGTSEVLLQCKDVADKTKWINAIRAMQQDLRTASMKESTQSTMKNEYEGGFSESSLYKLNPDIYVAEF